MASDGIDVQAIGRRVSTARQQRGLSQLDLALATHSSLSTIARLERGASKRVDLDRLVAVARVLDVTVDELLTGRKL